MKTKINFDILESLRGLAALYVCIGHCRGILWIGGEKYLELHQGQLGFTDYIFLGLNMLTRLSTEFVIIFFVLSGFSIAHSLRKNKEALPFYKRRFVRLYPPYVSAILWAMLVVGIIQLVAPHLNNGTYSNANLDRLRDSTQLFSWDVFSKNLLYLPQLDGVLRPFWSLTMEVIFYLLAPYLLRNKKSFYALSIIMFAIVMCTISLNIRINPVIENYFYYSIFFAIGSALYEYFDLIVEKLQKFSYKLYIPVIAGLFLTMIVVSMGGMGTVNAFIAAIMSILLIIYLVSKNVEIKWLTGIGRFSYTLYITHLPTIFLYMMLYYLITNTNPPFIYNSLVYIPCVFFCLGIAYLQYLLVEKRSKAILDKLRTNKAGKEFSHRWWLYIKGRTS